MTPAARVRADCRRGFHDLLVYGDIDAGGRRDIGCLRCGEIVAVEQWERAAWRTAIAIKCPGQIEGQTERIEHATIRRRQDRVLPRRDRAPRRKNQKRRRPQGR